LLLQTWARLGQRQDKIEVFAKNLKG